MKFLSRFKAEIIVAVLALSVGIGIAYAASPIVHGDINYFQAETRLNGPTAINGTTFTVNSGTTTLYKGSVAVVGAVGITGDLTVKDDLLITDIADAVTADVGSAQGNGAITTTATRVTTSASAGDALTLPAAAAGITHMACNHAAANAVDVFPASGDQINIVSANAAVALAAGECMLCVAANATNWMCVIGSAS